MRCMWCVYVCVDVCVCVCVGGDASFDMVIMSEDMGWGGQRIVSYALDVMTVINCIIYIITIIIYYYYAYNKQMYHSFDLFTHRQNN